MSTPQIIYKAIAKKLSYFKNMHEYTNYYQTSFNRIIGLLTNKSSYTCKSTKIYFQATMLINIGTDYSVLVSTI